MQLLKHFGFITLTVDNIDYRAGARSQGRADYPLVMPVRLLAVMAGANRQMEDRLVLPPVSDPATQHALLQMFETSRLGEEREDVLGGGRKRGGSGNNEEEMESPQSKRTRFL